MVVGIVGHDVENHSCEHLLNFRLFDMKLAACRDEIFITPGLRIYGRQCLDIDLFSIFSVESFCQEMIHSLNRKQS